MHWRIARFASLTLFVCLTYAYIGYWLYVRWTAPDSFFSHGFLVPGIFFWLIFLRRSRIKEVEPAPELKGLLLVIPALALHVLAISIEVYSPSGYTLPVLLGGIILYSWGRRMFKLCLFPLLYLYFAIPLPMNWIHAAAFRLKIIAVHLSTGLAGFLGTQAEEKGSYILFSGGDALLVGAPCSGLRSLIALVALGTLYGVEFTTLNKWGRMIFILSSVPIAFLSNILRILFLCLVADHFGSDAVSGAVHDASGYAIYIVAFLLMIALGRLLSSFSCLSRRTSWATP